MEFQQKALFFGSSKQTPGLRDGEHTLLTEYIATFCQFILTNQRKHFVDKKIDIRITFSRILRWQSMCTQEGGNNIHPLVFIIIQTAHDFQLQQFGLAIEPVTTLALNRGNPHRAHLSQKTFRFGTHLYKVQLTGCFHCAGNSSPTLHNGHIAFTFQPPGELFGTLATKNKMGM